MAPHEMHDVTIDHSPPRSILVTGASTGIGNCLARRLAESGHTVYATARKDDDLAALETIVNVTAIELDVTNDRLVDDALQSITAEGKGLDGLVNNAGVGELGPLNTFSVDEMRSLFEVNVFGLHRITNAFVRLLIESVGRIVNIGSQGGMITSRNFGPYTMTKHALEAYSTALGDELDPHGVRVSIVQPGGIVSSIGANAASSTEARLRKAEAPFDEEAQEFLEQLLAPTSVDENQPESATNRKPSAPEIVVVAAMHALFSSAPKRRYLVGSRWEGDRVLNALIDRFLDANDSPSHGLARDELVAMLDEHLAQRGAAR